jgi:hypothetical protein
MHHLCQQLHWLESAAGPPMLVGGNPSPEQLQQHLNPSLLPMPGVMGLKA